MKPLNFQQYETHFLSTVALYHKQHCFGGFRAPPACSSGKSRTKANVSVDYRPNNTKKAHRSNWRKTWPEYVQILLNEGCTNPGRLVRIFMFLPNILSKITAVFILTNKTFSSSHAPTTNLHITVKVKGHFRTVGPQ